MFEKHVDISIPFLWGQEHFKKHQWGAINYLVGPNGTGKSLLAMQIKQQFNGGGIASRYLSAERLVGLEKQQEGRYGGGNLQRGFDLSILADYKSRAENVGLSSSGIIILRERLDIRIKIEALLSDIFGKTIRLSEEGGFLKPKMQNIKAGDEYGLSESECHGLKELITLLTFLYDPEKNCIIFDEPELHLHPQYQSFFLEEIRKIAGNPLNDPSKKLIFIVTHSPYFIDIKSIDDLKSILVCSPGKVPAYVGELDDNDRYILSRFLPRFNTHHKQFFFSPNPVFVEGHTDQQVITIIFEKLGINIGAAGSCVIDVGGKDELGVFYKLCSALKVDCRVIADLDAIFRGRLRSVASDDARAVAYVQEHGIGQTTAAAIGELERILVELADSLIAKDPTMPSVSRLAKAMRELTPEELHRKRVLMLLGVLNVENDLREIFSGGDLGKLNLVIGRFAQLLKSFGAANVYILPRGEIEHYYTKTSTDYLNITNKDACFYTEREHLLQVSAAEEIKREYADLIDMLKKAVPIVEIEIRRHIRFEVFEWIHKVQTSIAKREVSGIEDLKRSARINYALYSQILDVERLTINDDRTFECGISLKKTVIGEDVPITFNHSTNAHTFVV
ncbi:ATP-dependent nuclease [Acidithiobacillus ferrivorans]|uniref:AAA family ATPase n=1 Tax=Acidithiobacillus ferrivorans TaxID=160808 RepID=A0A7T5BGX4_9PROT|nr:AAA family ATPase [Acidithiobacillus ferrivorans]QQD72821.1 AAA family ATPase [Acidithiobacillus ferrivorans]